MESVTLKYINELLKDAPESVLDKILEFIEEILEDENSDFKLSTEQIENLKEINEASYSEHTDIEVFLNELNGKYRI